MKLKDNFTGLSMSSRTVTLAILAGCITLLQEAAMNNLVTMTLLGCVVGYVFGSCYLAFWIDRNLK